MAGRAKSGLFNRPPRVEISHDLAGGNRTFAWRPESGASELPPRVDLGPSSAESLLPSHGVRSSICFYRQHRVLEPSRPQVLGRDPVLQRAHFADEPVHLQVPPELKQQNMTLFHLLGGDLYDGAIT